MGGCVRVCVSVPVCVCVRVCFVLALCVRESLKYTASYIRFSVTFVFLFSADSSWHQLVENRLRPMPCFPNNNDYPEQHCP